MCGIAGIWHLDNSTLEEDKLKQFTDSLYHRGPDGAGYKIFDNTLGFGHRRLSILDLSENGKQPMSYLNERYWITYNGEIFNFIEIKKELTSLGYHFKSDSDTEIIMAAYHEWGKNCLLKFNGMWAFAIYDTETKKLFLCRDRWGVKPLYYSYEKNKQFAFASETIAFNALEGFSKKINEDIFIRSIIEPRSIEPTGYTFYEHIVQLKAGCYIELKKDKPVKEERWWNTFHHLQQAPKSFKEQIHTFKDLFEDACKIRLRSDVPVASALSGGVDSSAVYCMVNNLMKKQPAANDRIAAEWQKAFVAIFPNTPQDEFEYAKQVINYTKGEAVYIEPDYTNLTKDIIDSVVKFDSITGTPINIVGSVYKAMKQNGITVSMDGHGADELMYGYRASVADAFYESFSKESNTQDDLLNTYLALYLPELQATAKNKLFKKAETIKAFDKNQNTFMCKIKNALKSNVTDYTEFTASDWFLDKEISTLPFEKMAYTKVGRGEEKLINDFHFNEIPYNLRDFDRAAMQHGIEIRMPFMDYRLVTFLFSLPQQSKLGQGYTKLILREAMKGIMPENIRKRTLKIGLSAPITNWFNNELSEFICDEVRSNKFLDTPYWNGSLISEYVITKTQTKSWNDNDAAIFWNILNAHLILAYGKQ